MSSYDQWRLESMRARSRSNRKHQKRFLSRINGMILHAKHTDASQGRPIAWAQFVMKLADSS